MAVLGVLVAVAALLRLRDIGAQPGGLFQDEAAEGFDAWRIVHVPGFHPLFLADDGGREPAFAYLVAAVFRVTGDSVTALRATAAVLGVLAVAATPLALRRFGRGTAIAGTAWAAGSLWLICVDRDGFRNVLVPLVGTLVLAALLDWLDTPRRGHAVLAGLLGGAGLWTYQPLKLIPLWFVLWLLWVRRRHAAAWIRLRPDLGAAAAAYLVVAAPMLYVAVTDPTAYFGRGLSVSAANPQQHLGDLPLHVLRTLAMVGVTGDPNQRHDVGAVALLPPLVAVLALLGAMRCWRHRDEPGHALLLIALPVFVLPGLLTLEGDAPHFLRALGLAPALAGIVGLGAVELTELGGRRLGSHGRVWGGAAAAAVLAVTAAQSASDYLSRDVPTRYYPYAYDLVALATAAAAPHSAVVIDDYRGLTLDFLDRDTPPLRLRPGDRTTPLGGIARLLARDRADLDTVRAGLAQRAVAVARDPAGNPVVWQVDPGAG